ncbi:4-alpha-glucanotransferase [Sorangium cellulosum]|uniref:4-alpha-glucanotransferase n=1 Tax=Sorangium cellulosum TaxID=56 RepID=A0A4P2PY57_SORCE|nr:4-alpha-glucanotransferase [Sorangium cellulosum]AUX21601.1 4-alpha-glucanotransferase [Sorangium cellulosum]
MSSSPAESQSQGSITSPSSPSSARRRISGVTVPLFSLRSERSWGIGEIGDLPEFAAWMRTAGLRLVQLLPLGEISGGETSPYMALSAFGIDPMYISISAVPELPAEQLAEALGDELGTLERARTSGRVEYDLVRRVKQRALRFAFDRFEREHHAKQTPRAAELAAFVARQADWLPDYAQYRAFKDGFGGAAWWAWPEEIRHRAPEALQRLRRERARDVLYYEYVQWLAHAQWEAARADLRGKGIEIMGDLPFMVARDSADVWAHQGEFRHDMSVGAPPDQFNTEGQNWGLPPYYWDRMRENDFAWLRRRCRYTGLLYDRFRIDHLVGFYRTYMFTERGGQGGERPRAMFDPPEEAAQREHGPRVMRAMLEGAAETGAQLVAEDLGAVPPWVRASLTELGVPGYKVLIWEKDDVVFRDPAAYPERSVACFGTHDTDSVVVWWESRDERERSGVLDLPELAPRRHELGRTFTRETHRALLDLIHGAKSELVLLLLQDVLATRDRVNTPGTVGPENWTLRLAATPAELDRDPEVRAALDRVRESVLASGRG